MQADIHDQAKNDNDSLFGSPPSSPIRGRSPALALPNGDYCTQNVGTIALPGSHHFIELPVNTPALSLSGFNQLSQRPPAPNLLQVESQPQGEPQTRSLPTRSNSMRGEKKKSSRENSSAPRPRPPPILLPDPDAPPPPNFLRNQQALLGLAGLIGGVHPANLSVQRHTRGSNPSNPIVVEDAPNPPSLGRRTQPSDIDKSTTRAPSNQEIIASLIKEKKIFPVLESISKLIDGNVRSTPPKGSDDHQGPALKRRKVDGVPVGATDWDVPFPFTDGEGSQQSSAEWETERGKQLIAQLISLIKNATRKAATRTQQQQHIQSRRYQQSSRQPWPKKQQESEPKIMGHYRPITATYGQPDVQIPEVLVDNSNIASDSEQASPPHYMQPPQSLPLQSSPLSLSNPGTQPPTPFEQLMSSLFDGSPAPFGGSWNNTQSTSGWSGGTSTPSPSENSTSDFDQYAFDSLMSIFNGFDPNSNGQDLLASSNSTDFFMDNNPIITTQNSTLRADVVGDSAISSAHTNPDFAIDPVLLAMSMPNTTQPPSRNYGAVQPVPDLATSPIESVGSSAEPVTPIVDVPYSMPEVYTGEQGMFFETAEDIFVAQIMTTRDPMTVASTLLQFASAVAPSSETAEASLCTPKSSVAERPPTGFNNTQQTAPRPAYNFFQQPGPLLAPPRGPNVVPPVLAPGRAFQVSPTPIRRLPTVNKQDILARAKERRRQLVGEIDRAKVELWETTIEQGVLAQLVKEKL